MFDCYVCYSLPILFVDIYNQCFWLLTSYSIFAEIEVSFSFCPKLIRVTSVLFDFLQTFECVLSGEIVVDSVERRFFALWIIVWLTTIVVSFRFVFDRLELFEKNNTCFANCDHMACKLCLITQTNASTGNQVHRPHNSYKVLFAKSWNSGPLYS